MGLLPATIVTLRAEITEFQTKMGEARGELDKMQAKGESSMSSFGTFGAAAFMAVGAAAIGLGTEAIHLADTFEISHARLTASLAANGTSFGAWSTQIGAADKAAEKLGFTNAQTEDALARLETMVKKPAVALKDLGVAEDVARARGMDLTTAAGLVGKASEGTYTALVRLGVVTKEQAKDFKSGADAVDYLSKAFSGQAAAFSATFAGKLETLKATSEDLGKNLGLVLIPIIEDVASALADGLHWIEGHGAALLNLGKVVTAVVVPAFGLWLIAQQAVISAGIADFIISAVTGFSALVSAVSATATSLYIMGTASDAAFGWIGLAIGAAVAILGVGSAADQASTATTAWLSSFEQGLGSVVDKVPAMQAELATLDALLASQLKVMQTSKDGSKVQNDAAIAYADTADKINALVPAIDKAKASAAAFAQGQAAGVQAAALVAQTNGDVLLSTAELKDATAAATVVDKANADQKTVLAAAVSNASQAVKDATTATNLYYDAALTAAGADIAWEQNLDSLKTSVAKAGNSLDVSTAQGRTNRTTIDNLVGATDKLIEKELASGDTAAGQKGKIQGYIDKIDAAFKSAGFTKDQIDGLNTQFGLLPKVTNLQINSNAAAVAADLDALSKQNQILSSQVIATAQAITSAMPKGVPMAVAGGQLVPIATGGRWRANATGGPFSAGERMLVGEDGPELVTFGTGGLVTPNNQLGGGGTVINLYATVQGNVVGSGGMDEFAATIRRSLLNQGRSLTSVGLS